MVLVIGRYPLRSFLWATDKSSWGNIFLQDFSLYSYSKCAQTPWPGLEKACVLRWDAKSKCLVFFGNYVMCVSVYGYGYVSEGMSIQRPEHHNSLELELQVALSCLM